MGVFVATCGAVRRDGGTASTKVFSTSAVAHAPFFAEGSAACAPAKCGGALWMGTKPQTVR